MSKDASDISYSTSLIQMNTSSTFALAVLNFMITLPNFSGSAGVRNPSVSSLNKAPLFNTGFMFCIYNNFFSFSLKVLKSIFIFTPLHDRNPRFMSSPLFPFILLLYASSFKMHIIFTGARKFLSKISCQYIYIVYSTIFI